MEKIEITLPIYDGDDIVDRTSVVLTDEQVEDVVNCAVNLVTAMRKCASLADMGAMMEELEWHIGNLDESLTSYSCIESE